MMIKTAIWIIERVFEIIAGALAALVIFGPSQVNLFPGLLGEIYTGVILVLVFYIASAYLLSAVFFGLLNRRKNAIAQAIVLAIAFTVHFALFTVLVGQFDQRSAILLAGLGSVIVAMVNYFGTLALNAITR